MLNLKSIYYVALCIRIFPTWGMGENSAPHQLKISHFTPMWKKSSDRPRHHQIVIPLAK